jgi:hypothetical protein
MCAAAEAIGAAGPDKRWTNGSPSTEASVERIVPSGRADATASRKCQRRSRGTRRTVDAADVTTTSRRSRAVSDSAEANASARTFLAGVPTGGPARRSAKTALLRIGTRLDTAGYPGQVTSSAQREEVGGMNENRVAARAGGHRGERLLAPLASPDWFHAGDLKAMVQMAEAAGTSFVLDDRGWITLS